MSVDVFGLFIMSSRTLNPLQLACPPVDPESKLAEIAETGTFLCPTTMHQDGQASGLPLRDPACSFYTTISCVPTPLSPVKIFG